VPSPVGLAPQPPAGTPRSPPPSAAATYGSRLLLDWLGTDTSPPYGIMLWWPFSSDFSKAPVSWFPSVSREVLSREFWVGNTIAVTFELLTLGPLLWLAARLAPVVSDCR